MINHTDSVADAEQTLAQLVARTARATPDGGLVGMVIGGIALVACGALFGRGASLLIVGAGGACAAFGLWGVADRELVDRQPQVSVRSARAFQVMKAGSVIVGAAGVALALLFAMRGFIGTWIS